MYCEPSNFCEKLKKAGAQLFFKKAGGEIFSDSSMRKPVIYTVEISGVHLRAERLSLVILATLFESCHSLL